jgi:hypothetical protein
VIEFLARAGDELRHYAYFKPEAYNANMTLQLRAHFDGRVIVPDETADIPVNQPLTVQVSVEPAQAADPTLAKEAFEET